ncbi:hypothetical protein ACLKA6_012703 [Drosophila palustris]
MGLWFARDYCNWRQDYEPVHLPVHHHHQQPQRQIFAHIRKRFNDFATTSGLCLRFCENLNTFLEGEILNYEQRKPGGKRGLYIIILIAMAACDFCIFGNNIP